MTAPLCFPSCLFNCGVPDCEMQLRWPCVNKSRIFPGLSPESGPFNLGFMGGRLHYSSHAPLRSETELPVPLEFRASVLHISSFWWRRLPLTASICKYAVGIFTPALLSTTLKPDCSPFLGATDACPPSRLNQTRSRRRRPEWAVPRAASAPTCCTRVPRHGQ